MLRLWIKSNGRTIQLEDNEQYFLLVHFVKAFLIFKVFHTAIGFTEGSAIGSLDHEMNNAGAGFMNAVYVLRQVLQDAGKKSHYVATMKWYNDFGEVYQNPFEYAGTTADRLRTISLWR